MDYESFKEKFVEDLKDRLDEQGADVKVSVNTVNKLNESYEAVTVTPEGSNIGVNIGIDKFYDAMENGRSYDEVVDKAVEVVNSGLAEIAKVLQTTPNYLLSFADNNDGFADEALGLLRDVKDQSVREILLKQIRALI